MQRSNLTVTLMDGILMEYWKKLEEYSVFSIPIFGLVIMKIIYYQLSVRYKYPFESELCLGSSKIFRMDRCEFEFCILLQILLNVPSFKRILKKTLDHYEDCSWFLCSPKQHLCLTW